MGGAAEPRPETANGRQTSRRSFVSHVLTSSRNVSLLPFNVLLTAGIVRLRSTRRFATDAQGLARFNFLFQVQRIIEVRRVRIRSATALTEVHDQMALDGGLLGKRTIADLTAKRFLA